MDNSTLIPRTLPRTNFDNYMARVTDAGSHSISEYSALMAEINRAYLRDEIMDNEHAVLKSLYKINMDRLAKLRPLPETITESELDRHSPLWKVLVCLREAHLTLSDNENVYMDNTADTSISLEELDVIINHTRHGEWSAIDYSDHVKTGT